MHKTKEVFTKFRNKAALAVMTLPVLTVTAFASEAVDFDLTAIMITSATKIVSDLMKMVAGVLPIVVTLMAASIGIAYGIRFIKSITAKAG